MNEFNCWSRLISWKVAGCVLAASTACSCPRTSSQAGAIKVEVAVSAADENSECHMHATMRNCGNKPILIRGPLESVWAADVRDAELGSLPAVGGGVSAASSPVLMLLMPMRQKAEELAAVRVNAIDVPGYTVVGIRQSELLNARVKVWYVVVDQSGAESRQCVSGTKCFP